MWHKNIYEQIHRNLIANGQERQCLSYLMHAEYCHHKIHPTRTVEQVWQLKQNFKPVSFRKENLQ